ncbi:hypothetical protein TNCV_1642641 [Trichonephila clavipes]|nr:hypothetical protein TNCV_1642641 [Trichonephila clavipes]
MNRDDSDLSSLSDENDYQGDKGSEMDNDEDHDTQYRKYTHSHGLLKKPSSTPSLAEDKNDEPPPKRLAFHIKQLLTMKLGTCLK